VKGGWFYGNHKKLVHRRQNVRTGAGDGRFVLVRAKGRKESRGEGPKKRGGRGLQHRRVGVNGKKKQVTTRAKR